MGTPDDIPFIAHVVMEAVGLDINDNAIYETLLKVIPRDFCQYNYRHAYILEDASDSEDVRIAGCVIAYDGKHYARMAERTFDFISREMGWKPVITSPETSAGEYYIDSLYIKPEYRGHSLSAILINSVLDDAISSGLGKLSLIADISKPGLISFYERLGFSPEDQIVFMGDDYLRMVRCCDSTLANIFQQIT